MAGLGDECMSFLNQNVEGFDFHARWWMLGIDS